MVSFKLASAIFLLYLSRNYRWKDIVHHPYAGLLSDCFITKGEAAPLYLLCLWSEGRLCTGEYRPSGWLLASGKRLVPAGMTWQTTSRCSPALVADRMRCRRLRCPAVPSSPICSRTPPEKCKSMGLSKKIRIYYTLLPFVVNNTIMAF